MKRFLFIALFLLIANVAVAWQPPLPENIYSLSENQQYLLQVIPMFTLMAENIPHGIQRNKLTALIYKKQQSKNIEGFYWWQEISFFRVRHPDTVSEAFAAAAQALISNDGNRIIIQSLVNPMAAISTLNELFIYDSSGNLLEDFSENDIFQLDGTFSGERILSLKIDEKKYQLKIKSDSRVKIINLNDMTIQ